MKLKLLLLVLVLAFTGSLFAQAGRYIDSRNGLLHEANGSVVIADEVAGAFVNSHGFRINPDHSLVVSGGTETGGALGATYGVVGEGHFQYNCTLTSGSSVVTCPGAHFTTDATVGQLVYGTDLNIYGFTYTFTIKLPQGTISSVDSDTQIHVSTTANATVTSLAFVAWGTDETTQMGNAKAAVNAMCGTLILPGSNPEHDGPAIIMVQSSAAWPATTSSSCPGSGSGRQGVAVIGTAVNATYIMPTPSFTASSCTHGHSTRACLGGDYNGTNYRDFSIFGGGNGTPGSGFTGKIGFEVDAADNAQMHDLAFLFWGMGQSSSLLYGVEFYGGVIKPTNIYLDGFGSTGLAVIAGNIFASQLESDDNYWNNLEVLGGQFWCDVCAFEHNVNASTAVNGGAIMNCTNCGIGGALEANTDGTALYIGHNYDQAGAGTDTTGTVYLNTAQVNGATKYQEIALYTSGATLYAHQVAFAQTNTTNIPTIVNNGKLYDGCGNTNTKSSGGTYYSGTGTYYGPCYNLLTGSTGSGAFVASGSTALGTSSIAADACATVVTVSAPGVATTDAITFTPSGDISALTGYTPAGTLTIVAYPTANNVNFLVCNKDQTNAVVPGAVTVNWRDLPTL